MDPKNYESDGHGPALVKLELVLTPEQLSQFFRGIAAQQHSVLTLREASHQLRMPAATLEKEAESGAIPAFKVDGKWRFSRAALDEWVSSQGHLREAS
ncbi:MAG: helix-turn-helix domain-containing protein [Armatimonadetes bacterium]|nr:helix-turn-helix domain-containing protein [Armatimonadota bacterium]